MMQIVSAVARVGGLGWRGLMVGLVTAGVFGGSAASAVAAPEAPVARQATVVTATSAVLHGELNPLAAGEVGHYDFLYEPSASECAAGLTAPVSPAIAHGAEKEAVEVSVTGLEPNREYAFCVVATNEASEPATSVPNTFKTAAVKPVIKPGSAHPEDVTAFGARLEATINPENEATTCVFEYGTTLAYGSQVACEGGPFEGFSEQGVGTGLAFLEAGTLYHYRLLAQSASGASEEAGEFTTAGLVGPTVKNETASAGATSAIVQAQIEPGYQTTRYYVELSSEESGGVLQPPVTTVKGTSHLTPEGGLQEASVSTGSILAPASTYYYRVVAVNATPPAGDGAVQSFTTVPAPSTSTPTALTATSATFNGSLTPFNPDLVTMYSFVYGLGGECAGETAISTAAEEAEEGSSSEVSETANVTALEPNAAYTVCFVTSNVFGSQQAQGVHFTTPKAPPSVEGEGVPAVTQSEALIEAAINPNNQATSYKLEYSNTESGGVLQPPVTTVKGESVLPASYGLQPVSVITPETLTPGSVYYYRVVAENATPPAVEGTLEQFTTPPAQAPIIEGESASTLSPSSETLEAQINAGYESTSYSFQYAEEESLVLKGQGTTVPGGTLPTGNIFTGPSEHATAPLTGLKAHTTYYYRVLASNVAGPATQLVSVAHFTTSNAPSVTTGEPQSVAPTSVTLTGAVNPDGLATSYYYQYGGTLAYGLQTPPAQAGTGTKAVSNATPVTGLEPGRTYHYRIVATNNNGTEQTAYGQDETFTTPATPPTLSNISVAGITENTATITATLAPEGLPTRYELQVGPNPALLAPQSTARTTSTTPITITLTASSLAPGTTYYYKLTATSPDGTIEPEGTFTTTTLPGAPPAAALTTVPYHTITELNEQEAREHPTTKKLTSHQLLLKALKHCKTIKNKHKRATCEKQAHHQHPTPKHTK